jgi:DNA polymerase-3 subunit chi
VLLNVGAEMPEGFDEFQRVLEVVSTDPEQVLAARRRWRRYEELGFKVTHHKVS